LASLETLRPDTQGKVRDIYDLGDTLMLVASDRISAFDVILDQPIPHKGEVLTKLSLFWFELLGDIVPNHFISSDVADLPAEYAAHADYLLVDDNRARKVARLNHMTITGSQGILLLAKHRGIIPLVKPFLDQLRNTNIRISERLLQRTLTLAKE
jgi:phosphoribosylaminoimidazole-succinocarboxamide synthase